MGKRFWSLALVMALVAGVFSVLPASAQEAAAVPDVVNIEDPKGDANYANDQDGACVGSPLPPNCTPYVGDNVGPASAGTVSDIQKVWFTSDADSVSAHILTTAKPPATTPLIFRVKVDPGTGSRCLWFQASFASAANGATNATAATLRDTCATALGTQDGELIVNDGPDGTGITTIKIPRSLYPTFTDGSVLKSPAAHSRNYIVAVTAPQIDNTKPGTDFTISSGTAAENPGTPSKPKKPATPKNNKPTTGKDCGKGKSKGEGNGPKKCPPGKPKPPAAAACSPYAPGKLGAGSPTSLVTADFTEEKPLEVPITSPSTADGENVYQNIQVGPGSANVGLFARYEFPAYDDHDIYLYYASGAEAAHAGGYNPAPFVPNDTGAGGVTFGTDGTGAGGHSEQGAEQIDGLSTASCGGYTLEMHPFHSMGGDMVLKLWLGPVENEPAEDGAAASSAARSTAADMFFGAMRMRNPMTDSAQASGTPAANKGCTKGGGKKKGCKKPPVACSPASPAASGAGKPTVVVTDAATAEKPLEQTITLDADFDEGLRGEPVADHFNVLVDSISASAGLYVTFEFPMRRDYDLWTYWSDASVAASSHGFNPVVEAKTGPPVPFDVSNTSSNHAGESKADSENIVGLITPDCGGWTLGFENYFGEGGEFKIKLWLGEGKTEPKPQGEETR